MQSRYAVRVYVQTSQYSHVWDGALPAGYVNLLTLTDVDEPILILNYQIPESIFLSMEFLVWIQLH